MYYIKAAITVNLRPRVTGIFEIYMSVLNIPIEISEFP